MASHGRHCSCGACAQHDWTRITSPCGVHGPSCPAVYDPRPVVHIARTTLIEQYSYEPEQIKEAFGDAWDAFDGSFDGFVISLFEEHEGSQFHSQWFYNDANPSYGVDLISRYDDE